MAFQLKIFKMQCVIVSYYSETVYKKKAQTGGHADLCKIVTTRSVQLHYSANLCPTMYQTNDFKTSNKIQVLLRRENRCNSLRRRKEVSKGKTLTSVCAALWCWKRKMIFVFSPSKRTHRRQITWT